jgi:hypothetical protein
MNIFFLHWNARICAMMHVDKHVVKMILETCQMLCTVHHLCESKYEPPYKLTHKNHPCTVWARASVDNYKWLINLGLELCKEYTYRYGRIHKCKQYIKKMGKKKNMPFIPDVGFTTPAQAMPDMYKSDDVVESYRQYYFFEKYLLFSWKSREEPEWVSEIREMFCSITS